MTEAKRLKEIFETLFPRVQRLRHSAINDVMKGKRVIGGNNEAFPFDKDNPPTLEEMDNAFLRYNIAIFTAFRGGFTLQENLARNAQLKDVMNEIGIPYRPVNGCYKEANMEFPDIEYCFVAIQPQGMDEFTFFEHSYRLAERFEQDSMLYKHGSVDISAFLVATNDDGRAEFRGDVKYAGERFKNVQDVIAWTDCSDGRFSFMLKGMVLINTSDKKIKLGEGNIFDTEDYCADGIVVIHKDDMSELKDSCKAYDGSAVLEHRVFKQPSQSTERIHSVVMSALKVMKDNKCKRIGFHCSASVDGSSTRAAEVAMEAVIAWAKRYKKIEQIVIVDIYGDYGKIMKK